jgi:uncharacterized repeat protein (TIGR03803 family)
MRTQFTKRFLLTSLIGSLALLSTSHANAQTFTSIYSFTGGNDGANPFGEPDGVILSGNILYGTSLGGGISGNGTVFAVNVNGNGITNVHSFTATQPITGSNSDGAVPNGVILSGNTLYGTATSGGSSGNGNVFAVTTNGTVFTNLHNFTTTDSSGFNNDGGQPYSGLILSSGVLYGTTTIGGSSGNGTIFAINTNGIGFTNLHSFSTTNSITGANGDGANPEGNLILSGETLYGTATFGGSSGNGTIFAINTNGAGFTNLHNFTQLSDIGSGTNSDGACPLGGLIISGNMLYGTANIGGKSGNGTVFAVSTNGTGFTNLHNFSATDSVSSPNGDGAYPVVGLLLSGDTLYGVALRGGSYGYGTIFALNTNGTGFTNLQNFTNGNEGANPQAGLFLSGNTLYGTASNGGESGDGTVFSLLLPSVNPPPLAIIISFETNVVLSWSTNATGFNLQSATNLSSPTSWNAVFPSPVIVNGTNTVTNTVSGAARFYRLTK